MYLKFVTHLKHVRRDKCIVQSSPFLVRVTIPFNRELSQYLLRYGAWEGADSSGTANKGLRQHLSLNHTICCISCCVTAWNINSREETGLSWTCGPHGQYFLYKIVCNQSALYVVPSDAKEISDLKKTE